MKFLLSAVAVIFTSMVFVSCPGDDVTVPQIKGCMDPNADNYNPQANVDCECCQKKGALLFWTNDPFILSNCGTITVKLDDGEQTNITGYYYVAPSDCVNRFGGYLFVEEGTYNYTVTTQYGCVINGGTVKVVGGTCNFAKVN